MGKDCVSPSRHAEFTDTDSMLDWVELLASETGLPVGIKSAVGDMEFWYELGDLMAASDRGVDFITIDGGEGGTGAAPLIFTDSVALPFRLGFARVYRAFAERELHEHVVFTGAGKLGLPDNAVIAFALGADTVNVGREAMLALGCIQSQKCHTDRCPTGVATQNSWLTRGLDPSLKSVRAANYVKTLAAGSAQGVRGVRGGAPRAHRRRCRGAPRRRDHRSAAARAVPIPARVGPAIDRRPGGDHRPHDRYRASRRRARRLHPRPPADRPKIIPRRLNADRARLFTRSERDSVAWFGREVRSLVHYTAHGTEASNERDVPIEETRRGLNEITRSRASTHRWEPIEAVRARFGPDGSSDGASRRGKPDPDVAMSARIARLSVPGRPSVARIPVFPAEQELSHSVVSAANCLGAECCSAGSGGRVVDGLRSERLVSLASSLAALRIGGMFELRNLRVGR